MSESKVQMTPAERQRLLRERRQAKMGKGKATDRLNTILTQGSSVKSSTVTSILDQEKPTPTGSASSTNSPDDDPDHQDISTINTQSTPSTGDAEDIDAIFSKILKQQQDEHSNESDPMSQFMKMFNGPNAFGDQTQTPPMQMDPAQLKFEQDLQTYQTYQQKLWKFRFLIIRTVSVLINFFYHFTKLPTFHASSYVNVRDYTGVDSQVHSFITWFSSIEVVIVASYYLLCQKKGLLHAANQNNFILSLISKGAMFIPQLKQYEVLLGRFLGYYDLIGIIIGDLSLVVVLFGLLSFIN